MSSTPHPSIAATAHFVEAERILVALPLATKRGERDHQMQLALVNIVLAIAASMLGPVQSQTIVEPADGEDQPRAPPHTERRPAPGGISGRGAFRSSAPRWGTGAGYNPSGALATAVCDMRRCSATSRRLCPSAIASKIATTRDS
jgi:hypothetical protein